MCPMQWLQEDFLRYFEEWLIEKTGAVKEQKQCLSRQTLEELLTTGKILHDCGLQVCTTCTYLFHGLTDDLCCHLG